ncbi:MAG TPA: hypothetical protein VFA56_14970 [Gaiellaceae bacterium]|nr:hypothetical protein [Gaiellaceae bacterium]
MTKPSLHIRLLIVVVLLVLAATGAYVFTASNTVPNTNAGSGSGSITGYTISGVAYNLNATNPNNIDTVTFTIAPTAASTVKIQLVTGGTWYDCTNTAGSVSCDTTAGTQATVSPANQLTVVATS